MTKFPVDAPTSRVLKALGVLDFHPVREQEYIALVRDDDDRTQTALTIPNHSRLKGSTLRTICRQAGIPRDEFLKAYEQS